MRDIAVIFALLALMVSCGPYPCESERMAAALEQAEAVYGDGNLLMETDTVLFIPGLSEASAYYARKKQFGKAALAALYNGYAEKDYDKEAAMNSFKEAERYGEMVHDSLTVARADFQIGKMMYYESNAQETLTYYEKAISYFGNHFSNQALVWNGMAASYILLSEFDSASTCLDRSLICAEFNKEP